MIYEKHIWETGEVVTADNMNRMENGVVSALSSLSKSSPTSTFSHYNVLGSPDTYAPNTVDDTGLTPFETVQEIYAAYDALVEQHPRLFKRNNDLGYDASGTYEIRHYTLGMTNLEIINKANELYSFPETEFPRRRILLDGNIHGYNEKYCVYGCYLLVKEILESTEKWAMFLKNNIIFEIVPQPNPWGFANKTSTNSNGSNLNRCFFSNIQAENQCLIDLIADLKPKGLVGVIDFHNTFDGSSCLFCAKNTYAHWSYYGMLTAQLESLLHNTFKLAEGKDKDVYVRGWNNQGSTGQLHQYLDSVGLLGCSLEIGNHLGVKGSIMSKVVGANVASSFATYENTNVQSGGNEIIIIGNILDVTDSVSTTTGYAINTSGEQVSSSYFNIKSLDVSSYAGKNFLLDFSFINYSSSAGGQSSNSCGFINNDGSFTLIKQANICSLGSKKGEMVSISNIKIPVNASTIQITWFGDGAVTNHVYDGSTSDFYIKVKESL